MTQRRKSRAFILATATNGSITLLGAEDLGWLTGVPYREEDFLRAYFCTRFSGNWISRKLDLDRLPLQTSENLGKGRFREIPLYANFVNKGIKRKGRSIRPRLAFLPGSAAYCPAPFPVRIFLSSSSCCYAAYWRWTSENSTFHDVGCIEGLLPGCYLLLTLALISRLSRSRTRPAPPPCGPLRRSARCP